MKLRAKGTPGNGLVVFVHDNGRRLQGERRSKVVYPSVSGLMRDIRPSFDVGVAMRGKVRKRCRISLVRILMHEQRPH
jgi:hypothetical protein